MDTSFWYNGDIYDGGTTVKKKRSKNYRPATKAGARGKTLCVNLFAGAGARKSTIACTVHGLLKTHGITSEYTGEYAKDLAWEGRLTLKVDQMKVFGEQSHRQFRLRGQVDVIISDSPLLLSSVYRTSDTLMDALILQEHNKYNNMNFFVSRGVSYIRKGRHETKKEAIEIDNKIIKLLNDKQIVYDSIGGEAEAINFVLGKVLQRLNIKQRYKICKA
ncbi:hypothetical protein LCGC14_1168310 [marine sediment metagenome]|uniref:NadR/Ttd14 AAA domain-containing protein n=1 Tax=marine sediment metagenome TaxID=412755 RepID=A0A0F9P8P3_9ZZZZ